MSWEGAGLVFWSRATKAGVFLFFLFCRSIRDIRRHHLRCHSGPGGAPSATQPHFLKIKLRYVNINVRCFVSFFFFRLYNNESHFVITRYCYTALYSPLLSPFFSFENILVYMTAIPYNKKNPVSILLIICISRINTIVLFFFSP